VLIAGLGIGVLGILVLVLWIGIREPKYYGKTVTVWFNDLQQQKITWQHFQVVIDEIGPRNACPFLLARIRREHSWYQSLYEAIWPRLPLAIRRRWVVRFDAVSESLCTTVGESLSSSDPALIKELVLALDDRSGRVRFVALTALKPNSGQIAIGTLLKLLNDPDPEIRKLAARYLNDVNVETSQAMLSLIKALGDSNETVRLVVARILKKRGSEAKEAVPALQVLLLRDRDWAVRCNAAAALWEIDRNTNAVITVIRDAQKAIELRSGLARRAPEAIAVINMLNELGASVKPAVPLILQSITPKGELSPDQDDFCRSVREVISRIDPIAVPLPSTK